MAESSNQSLLVHKSSVFSAHPVETFPQLIVGSKKVCTIITEHSLRSSTSCYESFQCHNEMIC